MKKQYVPQALKCYWPKRNWETGEVKTYSAILCPKHKDSLYMSEPCACGEGEYFPVEQCERCNHPDEFSYNGNRLIRQTVDPLEGVDPWTIEVDDFRKG